MSARPKKDSKAEKLEKTEKKGPAKSTGANTKGADDLPQAGGPAAVDLDEIEEQEDAEAASGQAAGGNAAALAAAGSTEMSASFKNFRHHPDMENFYRFIYENDLRHEALAIIDEMAEEKKNKKPQPKGAGKH